MMRLAWGNGCGRDLWPLVIREMWSGRVTQRRLTAILE